MTVLSVRIDGRELPPEAATVPVADEGLLRGDGVFEVLRIYAGRTYAADEHLDRMTRSAAGLRLPLDRAALQDDLAALEAAAGGGDAAVRLLVTRGGRRIALLESLPVFPQAVRIATVTYAPSVLLDGLKTLSYAANALASRIASERGADQALLVRPDGQVLEGPNFALFLGFEPDAPLVTPPLGSGILDSITRRRLLALVPVVERDVHVSELHRAREAFAASTLREVLPVRAIDEIALDPPPGPRTRVAADAYRACVQGAAAGAVP